jgi:hypothetical protein
LKGWQQSYLLKIPMDTPAKIASQLYQLNIRKAPLMILFMIDPLSGKRQSEVHPELWFLIEERARHRSSHVLIGKYSECNKWARAARSLREALCARMTIPDRRSLMMIFVQAEAASIVS